MNEFDHYKVLGLNKDATKKEVKEAFRKLAMKFHPDKHSQSSKAMRDSASLKFKQVSEAYEVLIDDSKRADYNLRSRSAAGNYRNPHRQYYYSNSDPYAHSYGPRYRPSSVSNFDGFVAKLQNMLLYLTTRTFLLNLAFAGGLLGGMFLISRSEEALWKMNNSGKSFEEAMESVNKARSDKNKKQPDTP